MYKRTRLLLGVLYELLLLLPRSALYHAPLLFKQEFHRNVHALLLTRNRCDAVAPSIFGAAEFDRYVVTRFLADADFYGHRPTV